MSITLQIPKQRVGNDVHIPVRLTDSGVKISWATVEDLRVKFYADKQGVIAGDATFVIDPEDNTLLRVTYPAAEPQYLGINKLVLSCSMAGVHKTYDKPVVVFVDSSDDGGSVEVQVPEVLLESGDLSSDLICAILNDCMKATEESRQQTSETNRQTADAVQKCTAAAKSANDAASTAAASASEADAAKGRADNAAEFAGRKAGLADSAARLANASASTADTAAKGANDAASAATTAKENADAATREADTARDLATSAAGNADKSATAANDAAVVANKAAEDAKSTASAAAKTANDAAALAVKNGNEAKQTAEKAAGQATTAATNATNATKEIEKMKPNLITNDGTEQEVMAAAMVSMAARIEALERKSGVLGNVSAKTLTLTEVPMVCGRPMVILGVGAPTAESIPEREGIPDFAGQIYISTDNKKVYVATDNDRISDWQILN